jgi:hypothetical protein
MIPDYGLLTLGLSFLAIIARFSRVATSLIAQLLGKDLIGPLRSGTKNARRPQALPSSE